MNINTFPQCLQSIAELVELIPVNVGLNTIPHNLGRAPVGHFVCYTPNRPAFVRAYKALGQTIQKNTITTIQLDALDIAYAADYDLLTSSLVAPHTGIYSLEAVVGIDNMSSNAYVSGWIQGSVRGAVAANSGNVGGGVIGDTRRHCSAEILLSAGEFVTLVAYHTGSGARSVILGNDDTWLSMRSIEHAEVASADASNLQVYSSRDGTISAWVW